MNQNDGSTMAHETAVSKIHYNVGIYSPVKHGFVGGCNAVWRGS
jgi:hypothetical protein